MTTITPNPAIEFMRQVLNSRVGNLLIPAGLTPPQRNAWIEGRVESLTTAMDLPTPALKTVALKSSPRGCDRLIIKLGALFKSCFPCYCSKK